MREERALDVRQRLVERGLVVPLSVDPDEVRRWLSWDLASLIEGHFHEFVDTHVLPDSERAEWIRRATERGVGLGNPHDSYQLPCWLMSGDERVGTLGIQSFMYGMADIACLASLYVRPDSRRQGIATRAIDATCEETLHAGGKGLRIPTSWSWQDAVRFYMQRGLWVQNWKHSLVFIRRAELPPWRVDIDGTVAQFVVRLDGVSTPLLEATNAGELVGWTELTAYTALGESSWVYHHAPATFALHLALAGWPLIRSRQLWERSHDWSDMGQPEGLALKIAIFEAVDRRHGFDVRTPRIPGLDYNVADRWLSKDERKDGAQSGPSNP